MSAVRRAFTLIELLVVIAIIAVLMAAVMPAFTSANDRARVTECRAHLTAIGVALDQFRRDKGSNPAKLRDLFREGYVTDDSLLLCTKTGAEYHYESGATAPTDLIVSCCHPDTAQGERPHSQRDSFVALQAGGKMVEVGR